MERNFGLLQEDGSAKPGLTECVLAEADTPCVASVVFKIDMSQAPYPNSDYGIVLVAGSFKVDGPAWLYGYEMTDVGGGIFETSLDFPLGTTHEFRFTVSCGVDVTSR